MITPTTTLAADFKSSNSEKTSIINILETLEINAPFSDKTRERPFSWWTSLCVSLQIEKRQAAYAERVRDSKKLLSSRGAKVIFSSVPTKPGIMPQNAALSTPKDIKKACEELSAKENHITKIASLVPEANFFYPFEAFKSRATDPKFFPNPAYHWAGESGWVFAEEFAKTFDLKLSPAWDFGPCEDKLVRWDIGRLTGVSAETPGCNRNFDKLELSIDEGFKYSVGAHGDADDNTKTSAPKKIKMTKFENPHVKTGTKAVVLSNSFGRNAAEQLASIFTTTYHFNTNGVSVPKLNSLYLHSDFLEVDYIILVAGDFHYPKFLNNARVKDFNPEK